MALVRECDICGCEIASMMNGYYCCTKVINLPYSVPRTEKEEENEGRYVIREKNESGEILEPIDICTSCFKEMVEFKRKEI